mmetsp:Transcript_32423/g.61058  ORF Transcript_32423/g.61058 Transcript_32423/m.61058 type:complete len:375 (-) Transcript_32423:127-1251(-)
MGYGTDTVTDTWQGTAWLRVVQGLARLAHPAICCGERQKDRINIKEVFTNLEGGSFQDFFEMGALIGHGTFGKVYCCKFRHADADEEFCVKVVGTSGKHAARASQLPKEEKLELLRLIASLHHPNIVLYHSFLQSADTLYVVMRRCLGPDLGDHIEAMGPLNMQTIKNLARMMLSALAAVHRHGLMHRDIKPENFRFKDPAATVLQLLDFGAAKIADDVPKAHTVVGTLLYAAPEVFDGYYSRSCDLWSCGTIIFLLVSGHLPFQTSDVTMLRSMHRDPVLNGDGLFRGRWEKAPKGARRLVRGMLDLDANRRLAADEAYQDKWLQSSSEDLEIIDWSPMSRCSGSRVKLGDLKRSNFEWNLAESDCESFPGEV